MHWPKYSVKSDYIVCKHKSKKLTNNTFNFFFKIDFLLVLLFWIRKISSIKKPIIKVTPNHPQHRLIDWFIKYWSFSTENPQKSSAQNTCWEGENMIEMIKWKFCLFRRFSPQIFVPTPQWCSRPPKVTSEKGSGMGRGAYFYYSSISLRRRSLSPPLVDAVPLGTVPKSGLKSGEGPQVVPGDHEILL